MKWRTLILTTAMLGMTVGCEDKTTIIENESRPIPSQIVLVSGDHLVGVVGSRSSEPITVRVTSDDGTPVENVQVIFSVESGEAALETDLAMTDAGGVAIGYFEVGVSPAP